MNAKNAKILTIAIIVFSILFFSVKYVNNRIVRSRGRKSDFKSNNLNYDSDYYKAFALRLKNSMTGINWQSEDRNNAILSYSKMNDDEFIYTYNLFNTMVDPPDTLRDWIVDELFFSDIDVPVLNRMTALGLA